jgi:hypothetical protein
MKIALKIISIFLILSACNSTKKVITTNSPNQIKKELVGTWDFEILHDENGNKVDTIWHGFGHEIPKGPLITLNKDGTYTKQFTPKNIDSGKWYFDEKNQTIVYLLYYDKPYDFVAQDLIKRGHAKKDENGDYFEIITSKVFKYSDSELTLIERENRRRTFKKKNE